MAAPCPYCAQPIHRNRCGCPWLPDASPPVRLGAALTETISALPDDQPFLPAKAMARLAASRLRAGDLAQAELAAGAITSTYAAPLPPEVVARVAEIAAQIRYLQGASQTALIPSGARRRRQRRVERPGRHQPPPPRFAEAPPPHPIPETPPVQRALVPAPPSLPAGSPEPDYGSWLLLGVLGMGLGLAGWSDRGRR